MTTPLTSKRALRKLNVQEQNARTAGALRNEATHWRIHGVPPVLAKIGGERGVHWERSIVVALNIDFPGMPTLFGVLITQRQRFIAGRGALALKVLNELNELNASY